MIDIHTHLLPFVDDGVKNYEESVEIISDMVSQGVKHIFLTPHYYRLRNFLSSYDDNLKIFQTLKEKIIQENLDISLHLANEIKYSSDTLKDIEKEKVKPLNENLYLIEFSVNETMYEISEAVYNMTAKNYQPILAHIERYNHLNQIEDIKGLKKIGAFIQVNISSLLGHRGGRTKRWIKRLIKNDLIDFIASDTHVFRKNLMVQGYQYVENKFSKAVAEKLFNNQIILHKV
ncbi:MAG TPA: CpsB/CapC family capsule biosynthesis tyrosine phosphatase [Candidatus Izemoplasmatales bacterium]|nr:CpsB/CapC family capsule biosynthesis tyrosine phosphatase [Candidatus Izemoplasmatales bacterium]